MENQNELLFCVTFYDEDGELFNKEINAINEDDLMDILDAHEYDVANYSLVEEA